MLSSRFTFVFIFLVLVVVILPIDVNGIPKQRPGDEKSTKISKGPEKIRSEKSKKTNKTNKDGLLSSSNSPILPSLPSPKKSAKSTKNPKGNEKKRSEKSESNQPVSPEGSSSEGSSSEGRKSDASLKTMGDLNKLPIDVNGASKRQTGDIKSTKNSKKTGKNCSEKSSSADKTNKVASSSLLSPTKNSTAATNPIHSLSTLSKQVEELEICNDQPESNRSVLPSISEGNMSEVYWMALKDLTNLFNSIQKAISENKMWFEEIEDTGRNNLKIALKEMSRNVKSHIEMLEEPQNENEEFCLTYQVESLQLRFKLWNEKLAKYKDGNQKPIHISEFIL